MRFVFILLLITTLIGCNGWEKDPFANESEAVRKGLPIGVQEKPVPPLKEVVYIDTDEFYDFKEGEERTITISHRILHEQIKFDSLEIQDLENRLPGSVLEKEVKGDTIVHKLTWQPEEGMVRGDSTYSRVVITAALYVKSQGKLQESRKNIGINVFRRYEIPSIIKYTPPDTVEEGKEYEFFVTIEDPESIKGMTDAPTLTVVPKVSPLYQDLSRFVTIEKVSQMDNEPTKWVYKVLLDLKKAEITSRREPGELRFRVYNQHGLRSLVEARTIYVETRVREPNINVFETIPMIAKQKNVFNFDVIDPDFSGTVTVSFDGSCDKLRGKASCRCSSSRAGRARCRIRWTPDEDGVDSIVIKAVNSVFVGGQYKSSREVKTRLTFRVEPAPEPTPAPPQPPAPPTDPNNPPSGQPPVNQPVGE